MDLVPEDRFEVFVRTGQSPSGRPDRSEQVLASCRTQEEAQRLRRQCHAAGHCCAIRFVGPTGGGD